MHVKTNTLHPTIRQMLSSVSYGAPDIEIQTAETISPCVGGGAGQKGFFALINLQTGESKRVDGSWGGANMFNPDNAVDLNDSRYPLPAHGCAIKGSIGHPRTFATIYVHPDHLQAFLPSGSQIELSADEKQVLSAYRGLTSAGRKDEFERWNRDARWGNADWYYSPDRIPFRPMRTEEVAATIDSLIGKGLLARNKAGAVSVTLAGKNAL